MFENIFSCFRKVRKINTYIIFSILGIVIFLTLGIFNLLAQFASYCYKKKQRNFWQVQVRASILIYTYTRTQPLLLIRFVDLFSVVSVDFSFKLLQTQFSKVDRSSYIFLVFGRQWVYSCRGRYVYSYLHWCFQRWIKGTCSPSLP